MRQTDVTTDGGGSVDSEPLMSVRLAREVRRRRSELGLSQQALARRGPVSLATLGAIESGRPRDYTAPTLAALDKALGWEVGHAQAIIDDERTVVASRDADAAERAAADEALTQSIAELRAQLHATVARLSELSEPPPYGWRNDLLVLVEQLPDDERDALLAFVQALVATRRR